jgi:hypothetical protein
LLKMRPYRAHATDWGLRGSRAYAIF